MWAAPAEGHLAVSTRRYPPATAGGRGAKARCQGHALYGAIDTGSSKQAHRQAETVGWVPGAGWGTGVLGKAWWGRVHGALCTCH